MVRKTQQIPEEELAVIRKHAQALGLQEAKPKAVRAKKERTEEQKQADVEKMAKLRELRKKPDPKSE